ncbi:hypothetical protein LJC23_02490 [Desulfovibrio sp. OttesenSCG-928-I05]|nr:hypothetical protein [Desulfovibrio sp. OttesenSCG-928-I05]
MTQQSDEASRAAAPWYFVFDLDGLLLRDTFIPRLATLLGRERDLEDLRRRSLAGELPVEASFRLRFGILKALPLSVILECAAGLFLDTALETFITTNRERCALLTENPDLWVAPLTRRLNCRLFCSASAGNGTSIRTILRKDAAIRLLKQEGFRTALVSLAADDSPMFREADAVFVRSGPDAPASTQNSRSCTVFQDCPALCCSLAALPDAR